MILPVPTLLAPHQGISPNPAELARVKAFLRLADTGRDGNLLPIHASHGEPTVDDPAFARAGQRVYFFDFAQVNVYLESGRLAYYYGGQRSGTETPAFESDGEGGDRVVPRALTDTDASAVTARLYAASGWPGGVKVQEITDLRGPNATCVEVRYVPTWRGVPYDRYEELVDLERQTGRAMTFGLPNWLPSPPNSPVPGGTPAQARLAALRTAGAWRGVALRELPGNPLHLTLAYWRPDFGLRPGTFATPDASALRAEVQSLGEEHVARFRAGGAVLAYSGVLVDAQGVPYSVVLDAQTGLTLLMMDSRPNPREAGGPVPASKPSPIPVPTASRPWRVATGDKGWKAWTAPAMAALAPIAAKPVSGRKVMLTEGKIAFPAIYDPKENVLAIEGRAYHPGATLAALLRRRGRA